MRAILPGRPQSTRQALSTAHWDGLRLVAYISGNAAVISSGPHSILQTLYINSAEPLRAITIEESSGRIAICEEHSIFIYEPVGRDDGFLRWQQVHEYSNADILITSLSWSSPEELLLGGSHLRLWYLPETGAPDFIWDQPLPYPTAIAYCSPDGEIIASCGQHDRMVKIWRRLSYEIDSTRFDVSYLSHPTSVTNLHWRKPWHTEQNLDSLLYTFCADNKLRVWAHVDHHSATVMHHLAEIDMCETIQPRRLSIGSMSRRRYAFIIDSRDFSTATEKAVQNTTSTGSDHALEHLIEIANRSPEILIVLDGLGHMSAWGLENAGCKNKNPTEVFNITHVADLNVPITQKPHGLADYTQFCIFAGGASEASLSILVHSFDGSISWHEAEVIHLFDTAPRHERARLLTSWAGHDDPVKGIVRSENGKLLCSWTDEGDVIVWKVKLANHSTSLLLQHSFPLGVDIIDADFFDDKLFLTEEKYLQMLPSTTKYSLKRSEKPRLLSRLNGTESFGVFYEDGVDVYNFNSGKFIGKLQIPPDSAHSTILPVQRALEHQDLMTFGTDGLLSCFASRVDGSLALVDSFPTAIPDAAYVSAYDQKVAVVDREGILTIWDLTCQICEAEIDVSLHEETVESLAWHTTPGGTPLLAVACTFKVVVFTQHRYQSSVWSALLELRVREHTSHAIGCICFLADGGLVVGAGNQLFVPDVGITSEQESAKLVRQRYFPSVQSKKRLPDLPLVSVADAANCSMPVYHPEVLQLLLAMNRLDIASTILVSLHEQLKFFTEGDKLSSSLHLDVLSLSSVRGVNGSSMNGSMRQANGVHHKKADEITRLDDVAERLKENVEKQRIPFLSRSDQSELTLTIDTAVRLEKQRSSIDHHGLCYLQSLYSAKEDINLPWSAILHASLSTSQEALVDLVTQHHGGKMTWKSARQSGLFMWLSELESVRLQMENVGRAEYTKHEDRNPVDCSLYYLALNKKSVLQGLWRTSIGVRERENTVKLLAHDFTEPKWKATALKNAYALMSKRRFEYAAAFFLLGGSLKDAVNVCVHQINDLQLAVAIARVYDAGAQETMLKEVVQTHVLKAASTNFQGRWMACWAYWVMLDQKRKALQALVRPLWDVLGTAITKEMLDWKINDPKFAGVYAELRIQVPGAVTPREEWKFVLKCAMYLHKMGCGFLALVLLKDWQFEKIPAAAKVMDAPKEFGSEETKTEGDVVGTDDEVVKKSEKKDKPKPTQFVEPSADSLLDSFGF